MVEKMFNVKEEVWQCYGLLEDFLFYVGFLVGWKNLLGIVEVLVLLLVDLQLLVVVVGQGVVYKKRVVVWVMVLGVLDKLLFIKL